MMGKNPDFFALLEEWWEPVWRCCMVLSMDRKLAHQAVYRAFLQMCTDRKLPEGRAERGTLLVKRAVRACEDYYYRKPLRTPKREVLEERGLPADGALYALLECSFSRRAAFWVQAGMGFSPEQAAGILGTSPKRAARLAQLDVPYTAEVMKKSVEAVLPPKEEKDCLTDELLVRLDEKHVLLEVGARRFKSALDRAVPWIALVLVLFCTAAVLYSAFRTG